MFFFKKVILAPCLQENVQFSWLTSNHLSYSVANLLFWCYLHHSLICTLLFLGNFSVFPAQARLVDNIKAFDMLFPLSPHLNFLSGISYSTFPPQLKYHLFWKAFPDFFSVLKPFMVPHIHTSIVILSFELQIICVSMISYFS